MKFLKPLAVALAITVSSGTASADAGGESRIAAISDQLTKQIDSADKASDEVKEFIKKQLLQVCTNKVFVAEVKAQNAKKISLEEIKRIDKEWVDAEDELPIHTQVMGNSCAKEISKLAKQLKAMGETFVMDNQGANVGQNALTSDYWQGDEAKWQKAYNEGKGGVVIGDVKLDKSTNRVEQKVSLPIIDEDGNVIGAVCIGLDPDQL